MMPTTFQQMYVQLFWKGAQNEMKELKERILIAFLKIESNDFWYYMQF
jgi:hypothetical protein